METNENALERMEEWKNGKMEVKNKECGNVRRGEPMTF